MTVQSQEREVIVISLNKFTNKRKLTKKLKENVNNKIKPFSVHAPKCQLI
jgi:hypothetical protein